MNPLHDLAYGPHPAQRLDLFRPSTAAASLVIFWHGGAWQSGSRQDLWPAARRLAAAGIVVATPGYRLAPEHRWPAPLHDAAAACAWLTGQGSHYGVDGQHRIYAGHSAGAQLAALMCFPPPALQPDPEPPAGLACLSGVFDLVELAKRAWMRQRLLAAAFDSDPAQLRAASPQTWLRSARTRLWLSNAEVDWGLQRQTEQFARQARCSGLEVETHLAVGRHHLNQIEHLGDAGDPTMAQLIAFCLSCSRPAPPTQQHRPPP